MNSWLLIAEDPAPQQAPANPLGPNPMFLMLGLLALFFIIVILPANRRQKREQNERMKSLKRGSKVLTSAGILGTVVSIKDNEDELVIRSEDSKLKIKKSTVVQVLGSDETEAAK